MTTSKAALGVHQFTHTCKTIQTSLSLPCPLALFHVNIFITEATCMNIRN